MANFMFIDTVGHRDIKVKKTKASNGTIVTDIEQKPTATAALKWAAHETGFLTDDLSASLPTTAKFLTHSKEFGATNSQKVALIEPVTSAKWQEFARELESWLPTDRDIHCLVVNSAVKGAPEASHGDLGIELRKGKDHPVLVFYDKTEKVAKEANRKNEKIIGLKNCHLVIGLYGTWGKEKLAEVMGSKCLVMAWSKGIRMPSDLFRHEPLHGYYMPANFWHDFFLRLGQTVANPGEFFNNPVDKPQTVLEFMGQALVPFHCQRQKGRPGKPWLTINVDGKIRPKFPISLKNLHDLWIYADAVLWEDGKAQLRAYYTHEVAQPENVWLGRGGNGRENKKPSKRAVDKAEDIPVFPLTGPVGKLANGQTGNDLEDVLLITRKLIALGFDQVPQDGRPKTNEKSRELSWKSPDLDDLIKMLLLFEAIIWGSGAVWHKKKGWAATGKGRVNPGDRLHRWISAANAPRWQKMTEKGNGFANHEIQKKVKWPHEYTHGVDWFDESIAKAGDHFETNYRLGDNNKAVIAINHTSRRFGGRNPKHATHQTGLICDVRVPQKNGQHMGGKWYDNKYDRTIAEAQVESFWTTGQIRNMDFNDPILLAKGFTNYLDEHDDHYHLGIYPPKAERFPDGIWERYPDMPEIEAVGPADYPVQIPTQLETYSGADIDFPLTQPNARTMTKRLVCCLANLATLVARKWPNDPKRLKVLKGWVQVTNPVPDDLHTQARALDLAIQDDTLGIHLTALAQLCQWAGFHWIGVRRAEAVHVSVLKDL